MESEKILEAIKHDLQRQSIDLHDALVGLENIMFMYSSSNPITTAFNIRTAETKVKDAAIVANALISCIDYFIHEYDKEKKKAEEEENEQEKSDWKMRVITNDELLKSVRKFFKDNTFKCPFK